MKFYIATRYRTETLRKKAVEIKTNLTTMGHHMTHDWMEMPNLRPYLDNKTKVREVAEIDINAVLESDIFILLPDEEGTGMYVEYGAALTQYLNTGLPKIYLLGDQKDCSLFNFHPATIWIDSIDEIAELN